MKKNATNALLKEYLRVIYDLNFLIENITNEELVLILDRETKNPDCRSIQTILTHIINAGYSYCVYILNHKKIEANRPEKVIKKSISEYQLEINLLIEFTRKTLDLISDDELEEYDNSKKIQTHWKQTYDIEQLIEHAIVHILRHRLQIEAFLKMMS